MLQLNLDRKPIAKKQQLRAYYPKLEAETRSKIHRLTENALHNLQGITSHAVERFQNNNAILTPKIAQDFLNGKYDIEEVIINEPYAPSSYQDYRVLIRSKEAIRTIIDKGHYLEEAYNYVLFVISLKENLVITSFTNPSEKFLAVDYTKRKDLYVNL